MLFMRLPYLALFLLLLVPQSQAVISDKPKDQIEDEAFVGYSCKLGPARNHIRIDYSQTHDGLPCEVKLIKNNGAAQFLLQAKRHLTACAIKAENMSLRLMDRGWSCQSSSL